MNLSFQPPEEDDPRDDDQLHHEEHCLRRAMSMLWDDQTPEEKEHYLGVARRASQGTRGHMGSTPDGGIDDHDEPRNWIPASQVHAAVTRWPEHLTRAVDHWFAQNTGLGGCSDSDVAQLAVIFYGLTHEGGRESVDDALAVVDSFGPGIEGLNDTYARQVILAAEVKRVRDLYAMPVIGRHQMRQALRAARDHISMDALRVSHCKDAEVIDAALAVSRKAEQLPKA